MCQIGPVGSEKPKNLVLARNAVEQAVREGAELVVLPAACVVTGAAITHGWLRARPWLSAADYKKKKEEEKRKKKDEKDRKKKEKDMNVRKLHRRKKISS